MLYRSSLAYALYSDKFDPLVVMHNTRRVRSGLVVANRLRDEAYRAARDRVRIRSYLPDRKPRDWLDAGLIVLEKAQIL